MAGSRRSGGDEAAAAALTGSGPSQLGAGGSMRARDVSRPRGADLAEAERIVQVSFRPRFRTSPSATAAPGAGQPAGSGTSQPAGGAGQPVGNGGQPVGSGGQPVGSGGSSPDAS